MTTFLTSEAVEDARFWHEGFCLLCGERSEPLPEGLVLHECDDCGEVAVLSAIYIPTLTEPD